MATQLEIVNKVLRRLREPTVTTVATGEYPPLIASFVNDAKEDLEDQWFWTVNETEIDTSILSDGTRTYDLTATTDRSFLVRNAKDLCPMAYDITAGEEAQLNDIPLKELRRWRNTFRGTPDDVAQPLEFAIFPDSDGRGYSLELSQGSTTARTWRSYWYAPQAELAVDGTADATVILLPERPIYLRALFYAMNERGEEMGEPGSILAQKAAASAAAAMELDMQVHKKSDEKDMTNLESLRTHAAGDAL
jgi:hypothetical protein